MGGAQSSSLASAFGCHVENQKMSKKLDEDFYGGFDDYEHAYDIQVASQMGLRAPSSYGQAPPTSFGAAVGNQSSYGRSRAGGRTAAGMRNEPARPMTAVRAAGYTSFANKVQASEAVKASETKSDTGEEKCKEMEQKVTDLLKGSMLAAEQRNYKEALDKAKDAGRRERAVVKYREQHSMVESMNLDLTFTVLFNLAQQYQNSDMLNEALNTYEIIVKNKMFPNSGRLKVNIGNIHFKRKEYNKAIKYYRMALDQVPSIQKETRIKILNNIGIAFVKMGNYDDALSTFDHCVEEKADFKNALNLVVASFCVQDVEKMREAYQKLLDIPLDDDDDHKTSQEKEDVLMIQVLNSDSLKLWERMKRSEAERAIMTATKLISPVIATDSTAGYEWCLETIKQSVHASLATELEMTKAGEMLKDGDIEQAVEVLKVFNSQDTKTASAAANNLCMIRLLEGGPKLAESQKYAEQALSMDRYNANALVNQGNIAYMTGELEKAQHCYREALNSEASCVQAMYNMGLVHRAQGNVEQALECFYKLHNILLNNVQVLCQLAGIYESLEDSAQAIELYSQANSLVPYDPSILNKLAAIFDAEGDKTQAFQCHYDSYRYYPSNMKVIEWMGAYYIETQFSEKAVNYFEKASIMQPNEIKWQLMMASSHRRAGNYQKALELYRNIHRKFPQNIDCLKFLVRITTDLGMPEAKEYVEKLEKAEKVRQLRMQRESDSSQGKRHSANSTHSLPVPQTGDRPNSLNSVRMHSASILAADAQPFSVSQRDMRSADYSYADPLGPSIPRPKTGGKRTQKDDSFDDLDDSMLPQ
ncbi:unnamed protein product [Caenorhabditis auriculariae]|uniref:Ancillary SecYEG translocon subunit/Cell division coordinator CpoB TPR domain-containing protein n=1 Tax=Caenorhabditis auriculariae TaxID=2777116 RepID=A0A8S1GUL7_9PELO|nr:unnamed protein product [Caenorhabditis auriculariae]